MIWTPHATVAAIVERDGRFLFVEELSSTGERVFNQPAGHVDENETILNATVRETIEESGWQVKPTELVGIYTYKAPSNDVTYYRFCYACEAIKEIVGAELDEGIIAAHWLTFDEILFKKQQLRSPLVIKCLEDYLSGKRYPLGLVYEH
tara:strand:+ start:363 stop:809 length:447 start_codon:yes stop_codon:yes gene_type:complete